MHGNFNHCRAAHRNTQKKKNNKFHQSAELAEEWQLAGLFANAWRTDPIRMDGLLKGDRANVCNGMAHSPATHTHIQPIHFIYSSYCVLQCIFMRPNETSNSRCCYIRMNCARRSESVHEKYHIIYESKLYYIRLPGEDILGQAVTLTLHTLIAIHICDVCVCVLCAALQWNFEYRFLYCLWDWRLCYSICEQRGQLSLCVLCAMCAFHILSNILKSSLNAMLCYACEISIAKSYATFFSCRQFG